MVRSGPVADTLRTGQRILQSDAGQITYNVALGLVPVLFKGWGALVPGLVGAGLAGAFDAFGQIRSGGSFDVSQLAVSMSRGFLAGSIGGLIPGGGGGMMKATLGELAGGHVHTFAYNMVSGQDWGQDLFDPTDMLIDVGGGAGG